MDIATLSTCTGAPAAQAGGWLAPLTAAMATYGIDTAARQAAFLAQIGHESGGLHWTHELWGPTPAQQGYEPPAAKALALGNTEPGDGYRFRGRGLIQLTGRSNYQAVAAGLGIDCVAQPELLQEPVYAAASAGWWWQQHGLNALADAGDFTAITRTINGGLTGEADRERLWSAAKQALGVTA
jgi:putative chitinase